MMAPFCRTIVGSSRQWRPPPFYFTTLYVPCEYDEILTAFYGTNWNHVVESRADGEQDGPKPLCKEDVVAENKILDYQTHQFKTEGEGLATVQ